MSDLIQNFRLIYEGRDGTLVTHALHRPVTLIGREPTCDLVLADPRVEPRHATLWREAGRCEIEAIGTQSTVMVNGVRISGRRELRHGDQLQFGPVEIRVIDDRAEEATGQQPPGGSGALERRVALLCDVTTLLDGDVAPIEALRRLTALIFGNFQPSRVLIARVIGDVDAATERIVRVADHVRDRSLSFSATMLDMLVRDRQPFATHDATRDAKLGQARSVIRQQVRSAMGAPILDGDRCLGVIYLDHLDETGLFSNDDLQFLVAIARLAAAVLRNLEQQQRLEHVNQALRERLPESGLLGASPALQRIRKQIGSFSRFAGTRGRAVLITGESGAGKEMVARALHDASPRRNGPFVTVNCAAIPENLIESELFGHTRGAFTGATKERKGKFEVADGGTLFLDEIADMSPLTQAKVLRAVELGEITAVGSDTPHSVDCWVLSATHKSLPDEIGQGKFREDLYYRLNVLQIEVPPLRERPEDIPLLAELFLSRFAAETGHAFDGFSPDALVALQQHSWPGNVRELRNEVERAAILAPASTIQRDDLSLRMSARTAEPLEQGAMPQDLHRAYAALDDAERRLVTEALRRTAGNVAQAAALLGITRVKLKTRIARHALAHVVDAERSS